MKVQPALKKTTTIDNNPAFEECERYRGEENCSIHVIVEDRFVVQLEGEDVSINELRDILSDMNIKKLTKMKDYGK